MSSIAVIGTSGALGSYVLNSLQAPAFASKIQFPITAVTTKDKSSESTDKVKYVQIDLSSSDAAEKLKGTDVLISLVNPVPEITANVEKVVLALKPKLYIPSEFGLDLEAIPDDVAAGLAKTKIAHAKTVREAGIKTVKIITTFFRIPPVYLYGFLNYTGIDLENKVFTDVVGGNKRLQFTTGEDIGNTVAAIATSEPSKVADKYRVFSSERDVRDVLADFEKEKGKFELKEYPIEKFEEDFKAERASGTDNFLNFLFYSWANGVSYGAVFDSDEKELVNPGESLWKWGSW